LAKASVFAPSPHMALGLSSDLIERRMARLEKGVTSKALNRCAVVAVTTIATLGLCALGVL